MAKKVEIELDVKGNIVESTKNLRALKSELKNVAAGTAEWNKIKNDIRDIEDALESAGQSSEDFKGLLENAPGPLGMLGGAIKKVELATKSWGAALKATGIGLLVAAIGGLVAAFSQTEGSMKKLEPLMIMLEKLFAGLVEAFQPLLEAFVEIAMKVLPVFISGIKNFYGGLMALFTLVKEAGTGVGKILKGIFTLDVKALEEGYNQLKGSWDKTKESFNQFTQNFEKGYAKQTATQKKNAADAKELADKILAEKLKHMEAQDKLDAATLAKMKAEALALATTEQQKLDVERAFAKKSYDLRKKDFEDKRKLYKEGTDEYKGFTSDLLNLDAEYINTKTANDDKQKQIDLNRQKEFYQKEKLEYQSKLDGRLRDTDKSNEKELQALDVQLKKGEIKQYEYNVKLHDLKRRQLEDKMNQLKKEQTDEEDHYTNLYNKGLITKEDYLAKLQESQKTFGDKQLETLKQQGENEYQYAQQLAQMLVETKQYEKDAIIELEQAKINAIATLGSIITQLAGKNKDLQILGLLVSQGAAIADILTKFFTRKAELIGAKAIYAAMIPNPITAAIGIAGVAATTAGLTANTIGMAAGLAGVATSIATGISSINSAAAGVTGSSGAGSTEPAPKAAGYAQGGYIDGPRHSNGGVMINAEGGEAVMTRGAVSMFGPLLSTLNQAGGGTSFNRTMVSRFDNPKSAYPADFTQQPTQIIKSYVVEGELTSAQQKQARLKELSTI